MKIMFITDAEGDWLVGLYREHKVQGLQELIIHLLKTVEEKDDRIKMFEAQLEKTETTLKDLMSQLML